MRCSLQFYGCGCERAEAERMLATQAESAEISTARCVGFVQDWPGEPKHHRELLGCKPPTNCSLFSMLLFFLFFVCYKVLLRFFFARISFSSPLPHVPPVAKSVPSFFFCFPVFRAQFPFFRAPFVYFCACKFCDHSSRRYRQLGLYPAQTRSGVEKVLTRCN